MTHLADTKATALADTNMNVPVTNDMEATHLADTKVIAPTTGDTEVITPTLTESYVHIDGEFLGGLNDHYILIRYADHMAFRLWLKVVYIYIYM